MLVRMAQRIGGFAGTTAARWAGSAIAATPLVEPKKPSIVARSAKPAMAATAATAAIAVLSRSTGLRQAVSDALRKQAEAMRNLEDAVDAGQSGSSGNGIAGGVKEIAGKSRAELYELAKKADIPGRSSMTKEDLAKALKL